MEFRKTILVQFTLLANYIDFITASPKVLHITVFVLVLATLQGPYFVVLEIKVGGYQTEKRNATIKGPILYKKNLFLL